MSCGAEKVFMKRIYFIIKCQKGIAFLSEVCYNVGIGVKNKNAR